MLCTFTNINELHVYKQGCSYGAFDSIKQLLRTYIGGGQGEENSTYGETPSMGSRLRNGTQINSDFWLLLLPLVCTLKSITYPDKLLLSKYKLVVCQVLNAG